MNNKSMTGKSLLALIIFIFTLFISINANAHSIYWPTGWTCDYGCGLYGYGGTYSTCSIYGDCDLPDLPYTVTHKTCLKTGCTEEVCMTDLFQKPLSYFYEYPYGYYAFYLLKPILSGIEEKRDAMGTSDMYIPDMFFLGWREKTDMMGIPNTSMCISPDIFIWSEPAAPPAF